ncbi:hypothetical protein ABGB18_11275 [Nonomuraea sp. B12E4]|uniref:hypothetical protein n=1 Tax=Nonomuraea sp. B12E4 TaxID=3153564 RepID=UPI00325F6F08
MTTIDQNTPLSPDELRGLESLCAALYGATETEPVVKDVAWRTFALIRAHREQGVEVDRLNQAVEVLGTALQIDSMAVIDELKRHAGDACLPIADVERFLKRERDEHAKGSLAWRDLDDVLDAFRLHMEAGTPLTEPRPEEGPTEPSMGTPPLTEAEELRAVVDRLTSERDQAVASVKHMADAMKKVYPALRTAIALLSDVTPDPEESAVQSDPQDGGTGVPS